MAETNKPAIISGANKPANANATATGTGTNKPANATATVPGTNKPANIPSNLSKLSNANLNKLLANVNKTTVNATTATTPPIPPTTGTNANKNKTKPANFNINENNNNNNNNDNNENKKKNQKPENQKPENAGAKNNKPSIIEKGIDSIGDVLGDIRDSITGNKTSVSNKESIKEKENKEMENKNESKKNESKKNEKNEKNNKNIVHESEEGESMWYLVFKIIIMVVILILIYYVGKYLITKYLTASVNSPMLLNTTKNAKHALVVSQDPTSINYIPIKKSDGQDGIQFTYGFWFLIESFDYKKGEWKHLFHKGNSSSYPNRAPGVWFHPDKNAIRVYMNTMDNILEYADIENIPIRKWVYMNVILNNKNLDLYINGYLKVRKELTSIPKQNDDDLWINMYGGFEGYLSNLRYYSYSIDFNEIYNNIRAGPSTNNCIDTGEVPPYLDDSWWFSYNG
jgi:hypothetical protein